MKHLICLFVLLFPGVIAAQQPHLIHGLLQQWSFEQALKEAEKALASNPQNPLVHSAVGSVLYSLGYSHQALLFLREAQKAGAYVDEDVLERATHTQSYEAYYKHLETPHFKIRYMNKDLVTATYAQEVLEKAYTRITQTLAYTPPASAVKIVVDIVPNAKALADETGLTVKEISTSGTIAVCKYHKLMITSPLAVSSGYLWADTLSHELTHFFISKKSKNKTPIWLHEGIAKYVESVWKGKAGQNSGAYGEKLLAQATQKKDWIPFSAMHPSMAKLPSQDDTSLAFAEVFTVIEFLDKTYTLQTVGRVLDSLGEGLSIDQALLKNIHMDLKKLETTWHASLLKRPFKTHAHAKPAHIIWNTQEEGALEASQESIQNADVEKFLRLGELLQLRGHLPQAIVEYQKAHTLSQHLYPQVTYTLAKAYMQQRNHSAAQTLLQEAAQHTPEDHHDLLLLMGHMHLEQQQWEKAQTLFETLRYRNPYNPALHTALEKIYGHFKKNTLAQQEKNFAALCEQPRPRIPAYTEPSSPQNAGITLITPIWVPVLLNKTVPLHTPLWNYPLPTGTHTLQYPNGTTQQISVKPHTTQTLAPPLHYGG
jgi:tetratricopeptide (TPR) repeat protein